MTAILDRGMTRTAPTPEPLSATLLDTITVLDGRVDGAYASGLYTSLNCLPIPSITQICKTTPDALTFNQGYFVVNGTPLVAEMGFVCQALGMDFAQASADFDRVLDLRESAAVEAALMVLRFTGTLGGAAATDLTPAGGAVAPAVGLAILEGDAGLKYAGLPTIHMPRTIGSLILANAPNVVRSGDTLRSGLGSKMVFGAGYETNVGPTSAAAPAGEKWIYATGEVTAVRGKRQQTQPQLDRSTNKVYIHAQRPYVIDVDCYLSAVRVKVS